MSYKFVFDRWKKPEFYAKVNIKKPTKAFDSISE
jgi:hypothetical protein